MCFGTVMFAYGGHGAFPTIQHDMQKPYRFQRAVCLAFLSWSLFIHHHSTISFPPVIFCMYLPVSVFGYLTYGDSLRESMFVFSPQIPFNITLDSLQNPFSPRPSDSADRQCAHHCACCSGIDVSCHKELSLITVSVVLSSIPSTKNLKNFCTSRKVEDCLLSELRKFTDFQSSAFSGYSPEQS